MFCFNEKENIVDIWVMQDYEGEVWALHRRVELPIAEIMGQFQTSGGWFDLVAASWDGDVLLLIQFEDNWLLQVDMDGKLVATFHHKGVRPTQLQLKQSLVPHAFFPSLHGYVVNGWPFIRSLMSPLLHFNVLDVGLLMSCSMYELDPLLAAVCMN